MDNLKEEILELTSVTKVLTEKQLFRLLMTYKVKFDMNNYRIICSFLEENGITLKDEEDDKKYVLGK